MLGGLQNISLTAFICAFKAYRRNSVYYCTDKAYKVAANLSLSTVTFKKYLAKCEELGFIREDQYGNKTIVSLKECLPKLFPDYHEIEGNRVFNHVRFFSGFAKVPDFKQYCERIKYALAFTNFNQQQWQIDRKAVVNRVGRNRTKVGDAKRLKSLMKDLNATSIKELKSLLHKIDYVTTGKRHIADLVGCCSATAAILLRRWEEWGKYTRTIIRQFIPMRVCPAATDYLRSFGSSVVVPNKSGTGYWLNQGSRIDTPTM